MRLNDWIDEDYIRHAEAEMDGGSTAAFGGRIQSDDASYINGVVEKIRILLMEGHEMDLQWVDQPAVLPKSQDEPEPF